MEAEWEPEHEIFISHAGEDKFTLAYLIFEELRRYGITAFLDREGLKGGGNAVAGMEKAMNTARICIVILSPEFVAKKWTMRELMCFLKRVDEAKKRRSGDGPLVIPIFYRLTVAEARYGGEGLFEKYKDVFEHEHHGFYERIRSGETSKEEVLEALRKLTELTGYENDESATNEEVKEMDLRRGRLASRVCTKVSERLATSFPAPYAVPRNNKEVVLKFEGEQEGDIEQNYEARVLQEILRVDCKERGRRVVIIRGGAGVGKSCILRGIGSCEQLKFRYRGGIFFIGLGMDATEDGLRNEAVDIIVTILVACGRKEDAQEARGEKSLKRALLTLKHALMGKKSLVLMDDLWENNGIGSATVDQVYHVLDENSGSQLVVTTRDQRVAMKGDVVEVLPRAALSEEAKRILLSHAGLSTENIHATKEEILEKLLTMCGGLPVCLAVTGRGLGVLQKLVGVTELGASAWEQYWDMMEAGEELMYSGVDQYPSLWRTLRVSIEILERSERLHVGSGQDLSWQEIHRSFCVMQKKAVVDAGVLGRMWGIRCKAQVMKIVTVLAAVGLVEIECGDGGSIKGVRMHDSIHEFSVTCAKNAATEKGEGDVSVWHGRLLQGYISRERKEDGLRPWWSLQDDGHIYENASRHLVRSGNVRELIALLLDSRWTRVIHEHGKMMSWTRGCSECLKGIDACEEYTQGERQVLRRGIELVRDAVIESWTFVQENMRELGYQMFGRLIDSDEALVLKFLDSTDRCQEKPWVKPLKRCLSRPGKAGTGGEFFLGGPVFDTSLDDTGQSCVVAGGSRVFCLDLSEMEVISLYEDHDERTIGSVSISRDGNNVLSCSSDWKVLEWDLTCNKEKRRVPLVGARDRALEDAAEQLIRVTICANLKVAVTATLSGRIEMWSTETGSRVTELYGHVDGNVLYVSLSRDGRYVAAGGRFGSLKVWDAETSTQVWSWFGAHARDVNCTAFSRNGDVLVSGSDDGKIGQWDVKGGYQVANPIRCGGMVSCVSFSEDGQHILSGHLSGKVCMWNSTTGAKTWEAKRRHGGIVLYVAMSADRRVLSGGSDNRLRVWGVTEGVSDVLPSNMNDSRVSCLKLSRDGYQFVSGHVDGTVKFWDAKDGQQLGRALQAHDCCITCIAFSPCGTRFLTGSLDNTICAWDFQSRAQEGWRLRGPPAYAPCKSLSEDAQEGWRVRGHSAHASCISYSEDGRFIVSGHADGYVIVWCAERHVQLGLPMLTCIGPHGELVSPGCYVHCVNMSADGRRIVSGLANIITMPQTGALYVWDFESRQVVGVPRFRYGVNFTRIDMLPGNVVRTLDYFGFEHNWRLDDQEGLIRLERNPGRIEGGREDAVDECGERADEVTCWSGQVFLRSRGIKLATLPNRPYSGGWCYSKLTKTFCFAQDSGQVVLLSLQL